MPSLPKWNFPRRYYYYCYWLLAITFLAEGATFIERISGHDDLVEVLKDRYNYASADCAARILATNRGAKGASSILQSNRDSYLLNLCHYNDKHVIIELCQDIRIDMLVIANYEYFSSSVRTFRVWVSKKYPPSPISTGDKSSSHLRGGWKLVGVFEAENSKREQVFIVHEMSMYARYVRIDFDAHYGNEYYCLVSSLRIFGKTMMEDFEEEKESAGLHSIIGELPAREDAILIPPTMTTTFTTDAADEEVSIKDHEIAPDSGAEKSITTPHTNQSIISSIVAGPTITDYVENCPSPSSMQINSTEDTSLSTIVFESAAIFEETDIGELFRQHEEFCRVTLLPNIRKASSSSSFSEGPAAITVTAESTRTFYEPTAVGGRGRHENIFKAIHDRIFILERNMTRSRQSLENQLQKLSGNLKLIQEEVKVHSASHFQAKLSNQMERRCDDFLTKLKAQVQKTLSSIRDDDRFLLWLSLFAILQITAMFMTLICGYYFGWFPPPPATERSRNSPSLPVDGKFHMTSDGSDDQLVPPSNRASPTAVTRSSETGMTTTTSATISRGKDLVTDIERRPLLLDESEAEIIEATYVPSPVSSPLGPSTPSPNLITRALKEESSKGDDNDGDNNNNDDDDDKNNNSVNSPKIKHE